MLCLPNSPTVKIADHKQKYVVNYNYRRMVFVGDNIEVQEPFKHKLDLYRGKKLPAFRYDFISFAIPKHLQNRKNITKGLQYSINIMELTDVGYIVINFQIAFEKLEKDFQI